jgi:hypothetical protein
MISFISNHPFLRPVQTKIFSLFYFYFFLLKQKNCNPFPSGIWGTINKKMPVKSGLFSDEIVKTLVLFEFEMKGFRAWFFLLHSN